LIRTDGTGGEARASFSLLSPVKLNERSITPADQSHAPGNMEFFI